MAGSTIKSVAQAMLDVITLRASVSTTGATSYLALLKTTGPPDPDTATAIGSGGTTEVGTPGSNGYSRIAMDGTTHSWVNPATGNTRETSNDNQLTFGPFSGVNPDAAGYVALVDHATNATAAIRYIWQIDTAAKDAGIGDSIVIAANALKIQVPEGSWAY